MATLTLSNADAPKYMPPEIPVSIPESVGFFIGKAAQGKKKRSDFEFSRYAKGISRRHAFIYRDKDGAYSISDTKSSSGTYLGGKKLTPGIPYSLDDGTIVSFGSNGADYIFNAGP